jgi:hypothetical protein
MCTLCVCVVLMQIQELVQSSLHTFAVVLLEQPSPAQPSPAQHSTAQLPLL